MKISIVFLFLWLHFNSHAQTDTFDPTNAVFYGIGFSVGKTFEANTDFPERKLFTDVELLIGKLQNDPQKEWAHRLKHPRTGLSFSYSDFGNRSDLGKALSITPFIEFRLFQNKKRPLYWKLGGGIGYFNRQFDLIENPFNRAITTKLNLSFKTSVLYDLIQKDGFILRGGVSLLHYSNGHNRLPNQGLNTLAFQVTSLFGNSSQSIPVDKTTKRNGQFEDSSQFLLGYRLGIGQNVLSRIFNDKKEVYTISASINKIVNKTFKIGVGFHYRYYEHYYDYIKNNEELVRERFSKFKEHPFRYATNFGVFVSGELLMGHIGAEFDIGFNFFKPAYKIDWILNDGYAYSSGGDNPEPIIVLGELNDYFRLKRAIPTRLGLKYYIINNRRTPKHNFYFAAHINANLGQADFSELSMGYIQRFDLKLKD